MKRTLAIITALGLLVSGCAGRDAAPVSAYQPYDTQLACPQLAVELMQNETKISQLQSEHDSAHNANVAVGVIGALVFWPALFAIDASEAQQVEIRALRDRNSNLARMHASRGCGKQVDGSMASLR